ncbi:hypothetical protein NA57DRAFT_42867 [Rhizodiscina lignyota]|uniref:Telomere length regulation protein conserved domain-containing protein n=1 Tax=Rhizodiscina lignyota TaxID=1504668 RepID=A0A9P4I7W7_9PEZI|nr:hypothetical protein NA57DRAFT_42867 [Rhizodiscina lignyota]
MDDILNPVSTKKIQIIEEVNDHDDIKEAPMAEGTQLDSSEDVLKTLNEQPSVADVSRCLEFLARSPSSRLQIKLPGPLSSQIIFVLVNRTLPDVWGTFDEDYSLSGPKEALISVFRSVPGLNAILGRLKSLINERKQAKAVSGSSDQIRILLGVLDLVLKPDSCSATIWSDICTYSDDEIKRTLLWKEYISVVASGRLPSAIAEAEDLLKGDKEHYYGMWISKGSVFAEWLGLNIVSMMGSSNHKSPDQGVFEAITQFLLEDHKGLPNLRRLILSLRAHEQRKFILNMILIITNRYLSTEPVGKDHETLLKTPPMLGGVISLLSEIIDEEEPLLQHLQDFLTDPQGLLNATSSMAKRAIIATLAGHSDYIEAVLEKVWEQFGNQLYIRHAPIAQQEGMSQPMYIFTLARSSTHTHGLSNRLASTSPRARLLGMYVGSAISELIDKSESRLKFDGDEMNTVDASWYRQLTQVRDAAGDISELKREPAKKLESTLPIRPASTKQTQKQPPKKIPAASATLPKKSKPTLPSSSLRIVELKDSDDDELTPYAKPDSDPEDDSPDPTLVNRNRPTAPIYIRDLLRALYDTENIDRATIALRTAPSLIRRKTNFGTEVSDHIEELATTLAGLHDTERFDFEDGEEQFARMRQKALQAVLVADPKKMGPWFARAITGVGGGEYSISQRIALLVAMGLGGREIAGFAEKDDQDQQMAGAFPSKKLKGKMHDIWASSSDASSAPRIGSSAAPAKPLLQPMALSAADALAGPDVLKVRKFSSRMDVEARRKKPKVNELSKIIAEAFFFPLAGMFGAGVQTLPSNTGSFSAHILPIYLQTITILLHSAGSSTPLLPTLTSEYWDLLLTLRSAATATNNIATLDAILFGFLTLLELNSEKQERIASEHGKELVETQEWARMVLQNAPDGDEQAERVKMLAAGVVVRCSEVVDRWRRLLLGDMVDL